ncbi:hypothetical protein [Pontibacter harenae]|uniref:hypothetical protein n=1 Tax=Pontibacter harenae TaxID=2894083 RepID=UPI001E2F9D4B|nr:hypothetical protein [Pontibacter harenae]MCC9165395.1 hypothetical protein [Pontibacter harenae]
MEKHFYTLLCFFVTWGLSSCTRDVYKRPMTVDRIEFKNLAGAEYEEKFQKINEWQMLMLDSVREQNNSFVIDTDLKKKFHKLNYTLEMSLEKMVIEDKPGLYYQLLFTPNSGIGRLKTGQLHNRYVEVKLYSPEENFFMHGPIFYRDSITIAGASRRFMPAHELFAPVNPDVPDRPTVAIDTIHFASVFKKRQKKSLMRIFNNAFVASQTRHRSNKNTFIFYPNALPKTKYSAATHSFTFDVIDNKAANEFLIKMNYNGPKDPKLLSRQETINREDFLNGHYYEAAAKVRGMVSMATLLFNSNAFIMRSNGTLEKGD